MTMSQRRSRWFARVGVVAVGAGASLILGVGCHGLPLTRLTPNRPRAVAGSDSGANSISRSGLLPATTTALEFPAELATIDPDHSGSGTTTPAASLDKFVAPATGSTGSATSLPPVRDANLIKARTWSDLNESQAPTPNPHPELAAVIRPADAPAPRTESAAPAASEVVPPALPLVAPVGLAPAAPVTEPQITEATSPAIEPRPASPEDAWRDGVRRLVSLARARQDQEGMRSKSGTPAPSPNEPWGLRARVLAWLAEPDIDPDLGQRDADGVRSVLRALAASAQELGQADAHLRGDEVRTAVQTLEAHAPLELVELRLCSQVEGFGVVTPIDSSHLCAGDRVIVYVEVDGVHYDLTSNGYHSRLDGRQEITPEGGGPTLAAILPPFEEVATRRRRDYYAPYPVTIPRNLALGTYTLRLTLRDAHSDRIASRVVSFTVTGGPRDPEPNRVATTPQGGGEGP